MNKIPWSALKQIAFEAQSRVFHVENTDSYDVFCVARGALLWAWINKSASDTTDLDDFEANYKNVDQAITLKTATDSADTDNDGFAEISLTVPSGGWYVREGEIWFDGNSHKDDIIKIDVLAGDVVVGGYVDLGVPSGNQGFRINSKLGYVVSTTLAEELGFLPAGLVIRVQGQTGDGRTDTLCGNISWGAKV